MNKNSKIEVRYAKIPDDLDSIKKLWFDYLVWGNNTFETLYGVHPHNPTETVESDIKSIDKFQPPHGRLLIAVYENKIVGLASLKRINSNIGEIKRMYVDPSFRRIGAGQALLQALLVEAKKEGYISVRLDSPKFMEAAHSLYRSFGFQDIEAYPEVEIPEEFKDYLLFMELDFKQYGEKSTSD